MASVSANSSGRCCRIRTTERKASSAIITSTPVSVRLPNSITLCQLSSSVGISEPPVQLGQFGHPMPEPVSRTRPPVPTMMMLLASTSQASTRVPVPHRSPEGGSTFAAEAVDG